MAGWPISKNCFEHQTGFTGNSPGSYEPVIYETHQLMVDALIKGEVKMSFNISENFRNENHPAV